MKLFDVLPETFFSLLSSPNQDEQSTLLFIVYDYFQKGTFFSVEKEQCIHYLVEQMDLLYGTTSNREKVVTFLRRMKQTGWLFEEEGANYEVFLNLSYYAYPIIQALWEIIQQQELEYTGYFYMIYSAVMALDQGDIPDSLEQILQNTRLLLDKLKTLHANIKQYLQALLNRKSEQDLKAIVENLFVDYKKNIIDDKYHRFKTCENITKYRPFIVSQLNHLLIQPLEIEKAASLLTLQKRFPSDEEAKKHLLGQVHQILMMFDQFETIILEIDQKNSRYIQTSISKILFIVQQSNNLKGKINTLLKSYVAHPDLECDSLFQITYQKNWDEASLYKVPTKHVFINQEWSQEDHLTWEEKQWKLKQFFERDYYNHNQIDAYVGEQLGARNRMQAKELPLTEFEDYVKLILIYLYSRGEDVHYEITALTTPVSIEGFRFLDFEIKKRGI